MFKLGAITVGQSPRTDVTDDIMGIFQGKVEILERGALDGLTVEDIDKLAPDAGEYVLVSRMRGRQPGFVFRAEDPASYPGVYRTAGGRGSQDDSVLLYG